MLIDRYGRLPANVSYILNIGISLVLTMVLTNVRTGRQAGGCYKTHNLPALRMQCYMVQKYGLYIECWSILVIQVPYYILNG